jgi:hypothetical protein
MRVRELAVVFALWANAAAAQEEVLCSEQPLVSRVDCEQTWALKRALTNKDRNIEVMSAYSVLRLTLAKHYEDGKLSEETYTKMDTVALEMFMSTVGVRQGSFERVAPLPPTRQAGSQTPVAGSGNPILHGGPP